MNALLGYSITYRIATGPREGQKALPLHAYKPRTDFRAHRTDSRRLLTGSHHARSIRTIGVC
jgi:hypothetical protein